MQAPEIFHARPRQLTRAEYDKLGELGFFRGERVELIHGIVMRMSPIGTTHAEVVDRLSEWLVAALRGRARVRIQQPFLAADESEPEPDVAVVPLRSYADEHPKEASLVIEVAESSLEYDRETKAPLYAASGAAEYWIVDLASRSVEIHDTPAGGAYARVRREGNERVSPAAFPDVAIEVSALFA